MLERELDLACSLAREAGRAVETIRRSGFDAQLKADNSPVTEADLASDKILRGGLKAAFPEDGLLSEESADYRGRSGRTWIIDPLDGTRGFINDVEGYAVQIGLVEAGEPVLGVVYEPRHDRLYYARRGIGAFLEESGARLPLQVSERARFAEMTLVASSSLSADLRREVSAALGFKESHALRSVGTKVGMLVRGLAEAYLSHHSVSYWDSCGPMVILQEAGGTWTHLDLSPLLYDMSAPIPVHEGPFLVTNGVKHETICRAASRIINKA